MEKRKPRIKAFTDLIAWQEAHKVVRMIYNSTKSFPTEEKFGIVSQLRRAALSVSSNIAEGFGRNTVKDKSYFYITAKGSLAEVQSQFIVARDLHFISKEAYDSFEAQREKVDKLISGLLKSAKGKNEDT